MVPVEVVSVVEAQGDLDSYRGGHRSGDRGLEGPVVDVSDDGLPSQVLGQDLGSDRQAVGEAWNRLDVSPGGVEDFWSGDEGEGGLEEDRQNQGGAAVVDEGGDWADRGIVADRSS